MSASLATDYRPRQFSDVVGQRTVSTLLQSMIKRGTMPQQVLFSGPSGTGKTTLARLTSAALLCETPMDERKDAEPCGTCDRCQRILSADKSHPDVIEIDAASHGRIDEVREISQMAQLMPVEAPKKVFIIDEIHGMTGPGEQAFLKTLEEPPAHVVFLAATTDPDKMLTTNRSRVSELPLRRPAKHELIENLRRVATARGWDMPDDLASAIVDATDPAVGVRGTLMTLQKIGPALDDGDISTTLAFDLLGAAEPATVAALWGALTAGDPKELTRIYQGASSRVSDAAILRALTTTAAKAVTDAAHDHPEQVGEAADLHATLVDAALNRRPVETTLLKAAASMATAHPEPTGTPQPEATEPTLTERFLAAVGKYSPDTSALLGQADLSEPADRHLQVKAPAEVIHAMKTAPHARALIQARNDLACNLSAVTENQ